MKKNKKNVFTKKTISIEQEKQRRAEAEARCSARRTNKLKAAGATDEQIEQLIAEENARTILCMYYGSHTVDLGEQEVEVKKYNKKKKCYELTKVKKNVTLRGRAAAEYTIREKKLDVIAFASTHCFIKTTADKAEEIANDLRAAIGRCYITKHEKLPAKEAVEKLNPKPEEKKKPTCNTSERKKAAKAKRNDENMKKVEMRPYYAALRKGGVSARIKKYNKTLADKIEKWLKERKAAKAEKEEADKEYRAQHRQLTSLEMKANKRARKAVKHLAAQKRRREREKKQAEYNAKLYVERAQKAQKPVQTELKMTA
jgi:hypothetical protein